MVLLDLLDLLGQLVLQDLRGLTEMMVPLAHQDLLVQLDLLDPPDLQGQTVQ